MKKHTIFALSLLSVSLTGCMATSGDSSQAITNFDFSEFEVSSPAEEMAKKDISQSKTVGAIVGGIAATYLCHRKLGNIPLRNAAIAACAAVGVKGGEYLGEYAGNAIALRRLKYASEYEFLEDEIQSSETAIDTRETQLAETKQVIADTQKQIKVLKGRASLTEAQLKEAQELKKATEAQIEENELLAERYNGIIQYYDSLLADSEEKIAGLTENKQETLDKHAELTEKRNKLYSQWEVVQNQGELLAANSSALSNMVTG